MRVRTFVSILAALAVVVAVAYFTQQNIDLLRQPFRLTAAWWVPLYAVILAVFLLGFLPVVTVLLIQGLKQDLATRRQRRFEREARSVQGSFRRAVDLEEDGQWGRASAELESVLADQPEDFETLLRFGEVLRRHGKAEQALDVHRRASVLYPQSVGVLYQLAEDYEALDMIDVAGQIRDRILRDFQGVGLRILRRRRDEALRQQRWARAEELQARIDALLAENQQEAELGGDAGVRRGLAYEAAVKLLDEERFAEARARLEDILAQAPGFVPARIVLGEVRNLEGDAAAALGEWKSGWESLGNPVFLQRIEDHFIEREEPLEAIETLRSIIAEAHSDLVPRFFLGKLYARLEMHDEALRVLAGLRQRVHDSPALLHLVGGLHERRGERDAAMEAHAAALELAGLPGSTYACGVCSSRYPAWQALCDRCSAWNTIEMQLELAPVGGDEPLRQEGQIWPVYEED